MPIDIDDYSLGADATPLIDAGDRARQRRTQVLEAGKNATRAARLDALLKVGTTAASASTAKEWGEGLGGAAGGLAGTVVGAVLSKYAGKNVEYGKVVGGFFGDKAGAAVGKRLAPEPAPDAPGESAVTATIAPRAEGTGLWDAIGLDLLAGVSVGSVASIHKAGRRLPGLGIKRLKGWLGKDGPTVNEPSPLGADAGPSPTDIGKPPTPWKTVGEIVKSEGKNVLLEAALKAGHTYLTATTAEEAAEGYGGAVGGAVGSIAGGLLVKRFLPVLDPTIGMTVGSALGDKVGAEAGGWIVRNLTKDEVTRKPLAPVSLLDPARQPVTRIPSNAFFDLQLGTATGRHLLSSPELARQQQGRRPPAQMSLLDPLKYSVTPVPAGEFVDEQVGTRISRRLLPQAATQTPGALKKPSQAPVSLLWPAFHEVSNGEADDRPLPMRVPKPSLVLPEPVALSISQPSDPQPVSQHYTFNTNMPVTINGSLDDQAILQQLEAMVKRTLQDLISRNASTQLSDPIYA
ncbi:hypothetical protein [Pseudomonas sp.]|uniref:hypothetical protein n=1 Tax=Pseudomonas sp. TaxID=306 RepID=UPI0031DBD9AD